MTRLEASPNRGWRWLLPSVLLSGLGMGSTFGAAQLAQQRHTFSAQPLPQAIRSHVSASYAVDPLPPRSRPPLRPELVAAVFRDRSTDLTGEAPASLPALAVDGLTQWHKNLQVGAYASQAQEKAAQIEAETEAKRIELLRIERAREQRRQRAQVNRVQTRVLVAQIKQKTRVLRACYERYLKTHSRAEGRLRIELSIDDSGAVDGVQVLKDNFEGPELRDCLTKRMRRWRLSAPAGGAFHVVVPLAFSRRGSP